MIPEINEIYTFKLLSGEEFVAKVLELNTDHILIKQPISTVLSPQGLQMMPGLFSSNQDKNVRLNNSSWAMMAETREDVKSSYIQATTGIAVGKQILTG
jgi:vacuolar-type H+-ATPase subunit E/Vma4